MGGFYMAYLESLCRRRGWRDPLYETYRTSNGYTCLVLVNGREYQTDRAYESDGIAQENGAMRAFMVCRNFSANDAMMARNGVVQSLPHNDSVSTRHRHRRTTSHFNAASSSSSSDSGYGSGTSSSIPVTSAPAQGVVVEDLVKIACIETLATNFAKVKMPPNLETDRVEDILTEAMFHDVMLIELSLEIFDTTSPVSFRGIYEELMHMCIIDAGTENKINMEKDVYTVLSDHCSYITNLLYEQLALALPADGNKTQDNKTSSDVPTKNNRGPASPWKIRIFKEVRKFISPRKVSSDKPLLEPESKNMFAGIIEKMTSKLEIWCTVLRREVDSFSAIHLRDALRRLDAFEARLLLETRFDKVATGEYAWIQELSKLGYSAKEISDELLEKSLQGPWIYSAFQVSSVERFQEGFHLVGCVHETPTTGRAKMQAHHSKEVSTSLDPIYSTSPESSIRESVEFLCGLGGVRPALDGPEAGELDCIRFEDENTTAIISSISTGHRQISEILQGMLRNLEGAACILQRAGGCCDSFTFLTLCGSHVELHKVDLVSLRHFAEMLDRYARKEENECLYELGVIWRELFSWVQSDSLISQYDSTGGDSANSAPYAWCLAVQFMSVALLSYAQAHAGPLRPFFLDTAQKRVVITNCQDSKGASGFPCIVGSLVELTCMGDMTQQSVFVFQYQHRYNEKDILDTSTRRYDLVARPEDLLDTWGPGEFITDANDPSRLFAICVGGGSIIASEVEKDTVLHWSREPVSNKQLTVAFKRGSRTKIGARVLENVRCQADTKKQMSDAVALLEELGTFPSYWEVRERQIGLGIQGGQGALAAFQFNQTWVKMRGLTKKSMLLVQQAVYTADLDNLFGVQVSVCTGIARRVRLRDLLADVLPAYVAGLVTTPRLWKSLSEDLNIIEALRVLDLRIWLSELDHDHQQTFENLVSAVLFLLQDTGVDRKGQNFVIACIQPDLPFQCFKVPCRKESYWARMLADSEEIATFAYITTQCLETTQVKCRGPGASWANTTGLLMTAVSCYQERIGALPSSSSSTQWVLKHSEAYLIGKPDAPLFVQVDRPDNNDEPRLLVSLSNIPSEYLYRLYRKGKPGKPRRLREKKTSDQFAESVVVLMN